MRLTTRVKSKVDAEEAAELRCTVCDVWKSPTEFGIEHKINKGRAARYGRRCKECDKRRWSMSKVLGRIPSHIEVREALGKPIGESVGAALNQARHSKRKSTPLTPEELAALHKRREAKERREGKPDMVYLVGMEGDDKAVKIGHSTDAYARLGEYQAGNCLKLKVLALIPGGQQKEQQLHQKHIKEHPTHYVGEWFQKSPGIMNEFTEGMVTA